MQEIEKKLQGKTKSALLVGSGLNSSIEYKGITPLPHFAVSCPSHIKKKNYNKVPILVVFNFDNTFTSIFSILKSKTTKHRVDSFNKADCNDCDLCYIGKIF